MKFKRDCYVVLAASWLVHAAATSSRAGMRIINGSTVGSNSHFHQSFALPTSTGDSDEWLGCGASIISPTFAMTSAHCFGGGSNPCSGPKEIALWIGDIRLEQGVVVARDEGNSFRVKAELLCNPAFDGKCSHGNDVALLRLKEAVPNWVKPFPLDISDSAADKPGDSISPMGFGLMEEKKDHTVIGFAGSPTLRSVSVTVLAQDSEDCSRMYAGGYGCSDPESEGAAQNLDMQVCAGSVGDDDHDACSGDSGSPVVDASGTQVAIVSYGGGPGERMSGPGRICGDPRYPGVYARVSSFREFIQKHVTDLPSQAGDSFVSVSSEERRSSISAHLRR